LNQIEYRAGNQLSLDSVLDLYRESGLGERRPIDDREAFATMLSHANLVITAWEGDLLVGIARTLTDSPMSATSAIWRYVDRTSGTVLEQC